MRDITQFMSIVNWSTVSDQSNILCILCTHCITICGIIREHTRCFVNQKLFHVIKINTLNVLAKNNLLLNGLKPQCSMYLFCAFSLSKMFKL